MNLDKKVFKRNRCVCVGGWRWSDSKSAFLDLEVYKPVKHSNGDVLYAVG